MSIIITWLLRKTENSQLILTEPLKVNRNEMLSYRGHRMCVSLSGVTRH